MATRAGHSTTRSPRYALGPGADLPVARIVAVLLILLPIAAWFVISNILKTGPSQDAVDLANFNPRSVFSDTTPHFLPPPVAAIPAEANTGPPAPASSEPNPNKTSADAPAEHVKVANTGGVGAILRADPPKGHQVGALRDGTFLQVLEHRQLDDGSEWLRVHTPDGAEGWVFSKLVAASE